MDTQEGQPLSRNSDWQAICSIQGSNHDRVGYVQDHAHHCAKLLCPGNPSDSAIHQLEPKREVGRR
jgi:hypothetical protein